MRYAMTLEWHAREGREALFTGDAAVPCGLTSRFADLTQLPIGGEQLVM